VRREFITTILGLREQADGRRQREGSAGQRSSRWFGVAAKQLESADVDLLRKRVWVMAEALMGT
jgi:hypothetical protein